MPVATMILVLAGGYTQRIVRASQLAFDTAVADDVHTGDALHVGVHLPRDHYQAVCSRGRLPLRAIWREEKHT